MKILVAGGAGFIGSHLIDALVNKGHKVVCIDDFSLGRKDNIVHLLNDSNFSFYKENICNFDNLLELFKKENFDYVFHLAANSDIKQSSNKPEIELKNTYMTTYNLLECMRICEVKKLFFASTSAVYGDKNGIELNENTPNLEPVSYYGSAKLGSEALISAYTYMNDFESLIFRFPNVIGERLTHGVIFDFIAKLRENSSSLEILGDGKQTKPYIYIDDLILAIMMLMDKVEKGFSLYNVGVNSETDVITIADILCNEMGLKNVNYRFTGGVGGWKGDVAKFKYGLDKIHKIGWKAKYTSDEAVKKTISLILRKQ